MLLPELRRAPKWKKPKLPRPSWSEKLRLFFEPCLWGDSSREELAKEGLTKREEETDYDNDVNLISSEIISDKPEKYHLPLIDLDIESWLVPSSTPGHYHLVINKPLTELEYHALLTVLNKIGILQDRVYKRWLDDKRTYIRRPGDKK